jgi:hypothetical protein
VAVALRDALAELLGVQAAELGCDAREMLAGEGVPCQSIFIFDRFAAGYASGADRLLSQMFYKAAQLLNCPNQCDSCCSNCILDFDQRFDAGTLNRHAALKVLSSAWLKKLKLPDNLQYFGADSRAESDTLFEAVAKESGQVDAIAVRLYAGGDPPCWDFAGSAVRQLAYKLLAMSHPVAVLIPKDVLGKLADEDRYSLAALAEHPNGTVRLVAKLPSMKGAILLADVTRSHGCTAWASADSADAIAAKEWGQCRSSPLIVGPKADEELGEPCTNSSLRPLPVDDGDREVSVQRQLDGDLKTFGVRFWNLLRQGHPASKKVLDNTIARVTSISYSDRYLFTPLSIALILQIVTGLKRAIGEERFCNPDLLLTTTALRPDGQRSVGSKVYADWLVTKMRDEVATLVLQQLGNTKVRCTEKMAHMRSLEAAFSTGESVTIRLDQGVSYWRVASWAKGGPRASWFDFDNPNVAVQAKAVQGMDVWIEGQLAPTQMFAKVRRAQGAVVKK